LTVEIVKIREVLLMKIEKMIGLAWVCGTLFFAGIPQEKSLAAPMCKFQSGKTYQAIGGFGGGNRSSDIVVVFERDVVGNNTPVSLFSGVWRLSDGTSGDEKITLQASSSTFIMVRHMDAGLKQLWSGKCQADNLITGDLWDPTIGKGSFSMKL
jgi:hypothetical protein